MLSNIFGTRKRVFTIFAIVANEARMKVDFVPGQITIVGELLMTIAAFINNMLSLRSTPIFISINDFYCHPDDLLFCVTPTLAVVVSCFCKLDTKEIHLD